ncbi:MAG: CocE/NonD family hydrolase [Thermoleophilia bacterium]
MGARPLPGMPDVTVERDVPCAMRDGTILRADVYRPARGGPFPVLLQRLPYDKTAAQANVGFAHPSWYARHGYVVVVQDCRGRTASEGEWVPFVHEAEDGYDTIAWAASLPGTTGKVGMYGFSYPGIVQLWAAALRPPALAAICPAFTGSQAYEGWTYRQGALQLGFVGFWATLLELDVARRAGDEARLATLTGLLGQYPGLNWALPVRSLPGLEDVAWFQDWLAHPEHDDYWRRFSVDEDYGRIAVPALHVGGWYDVFAAGTVQNFARLRDEAGAPAARAAQKLLVGPWHHMPWRPLAGATGEVGPNVVDDWQLRWLDQHLKGIETGVLDAPATVYVVGDGWRDLDGWPPSGTRQVDWFLHSGGRANTATGDGTLSTEPPGDEPPDVFLHDPSVPTPSLGGHSCCVEGLSPQGPACQAASEALRGVLVYTSAPLERELELVGDVTLTLHAATSAPDTDWTCRLCVVDEGGCSTNLVEGIVRARYRLGTDRAVPIRPGEVLEYEIRLGPVGWRVRAGQRLRVDVSSSDFPQWERNGNTGALPGTDTALSFQVATQVVCHDRARPSRIALPILG